MKTALYCIIVAVVWPLLMVAYLFTSGKDQSEISAGWDGGAE